MTVLVSFIIAFVMFYFKYFVVIENFSSLNNMANFKMANLNMAKLNILTNMIREKMIK